MPRHERSPWSSAPARVRRQRALVRAARRAGIAPAAPREPSEPAPDGSHTTVDATIRPVGDAGYRRLDWAPGEPHVLRDDLGARPSPDRERTRRSLLYVAHHTDSHVCDAQSPARLEGGDVFGWVNPGADGGHRPQETCTTQVLDRLVAATNAVATSPLSGARMAWCLHTGDNTDNRTAAEVRWWIDVLDGRPVTPNTGLEGRYEGVQRSGWRSVWHPDRAAWDRRARAGFPHLPGFLDAAVAPFDPIGLEVPWLAVLGNHDSVFQGTFGPADRIGLHRVGEILAGSGRKPVGPRGLRQALLFARAGADADLWERRSRGRWVAEVTPDPDARRPLSADEYLAALLEEHAEPGPGPHGHGFTEGDRAAGATWWSRSGGEHVQVIGLDTCNHTDGVDGSLGPRQRAWLEDELVACHSRYLDADGRWRDGPGPDRLVVLASHHTTWTMANQVEDEADPGPRTLGPEIEALLDRFPNVVLWLNGHTHMHQVVSHERSTGGGWWEVNTASGVDFGQQGRTVELFDNGDGTISIVTTVIDHAGPPRVRHRRDGRWTVAELASVSRELSLNDAVWGDPLDLLGDVTDRNVELPVPAPFAFR